MGRDRNNFLVGIAAAESGTESGLFKLLPMLQTPGHRTDCQPGGQDPAVGQWRFLRGRSAGRRIARGRGAAERKNQRRRLERMGLAVRHRFSACWRLIRSRECRGFRRFFSLFRIGPWRRSAMGRMLREGLPDPKGGSAGVGPIARFMTGLKGCTRACLFKDQGIPTWLLRGSESMP